MERKFLGAFGDYYVAREIPTVALGEMASCRHTGIRTRLLTGTGSSPLCAVASLRPPVKVGACPSEPPVYALEALIRSASMVRPRGRASSVWRRGWDSNPRSLSGQRFSRLEEENT